MNQSIPCYYSRSFQDAPDWTHFGIIFYWLVFTANKKIAAGTSQPSLLFFLVNSGPPSFFRNVSMQ